MVEGREVTDAVCLSELLGCLLNVMPPKATPLPLPTFEDEATLFSLASEFYVAAETLAKASPTTMGYKTVIYYLAGHAGELLLKSFLFKNGVPIEDLAKRYGHNLKNLVKTSRLRGLPPTVVTEHIQSFSGVYTKKRTEYRQTKQLRFPPIDLLMSEIKGLQTYVFSHVAQF